jgi:hypothetical protein
VRTDVTLQDLAELEIKPEELLAEFRAISERSIRDAFPAASLRRIPCPACGSEDDAPAFEKLGLLYRECRSCGSLFVSPRPAQDALDRYYERSPAASFWRERLLGATAEVRLEKLVAPRADWVIDGIAEHLPGARRVDDRSTGGDLLADLLAAQGVQLGSGPPADVITAFDRFDRVADLRALVADIARDLRAGGLLFATAPCASGFEVQTLWERNETLLPPDKLNVPSVEGLRRLLAPPRWEILELSTPGMFDAENVRRAVAQDPPSWPRAVRALIAAAEDDGSALQELLQRTRRASFARVIARRVA